MKALLSLITLSLCSCGGTKLKPTFNPSGDTQICVGPACVKLIPSK